MATYNEIVYNLSNSCITVTSYTLLADKEDWLISTSPVDVTGNITPVLVRVSLNDTLTLDILYLLYIL